MSVEGYKIIIGILNAVIVLIIMILLFIIMG